MMGKKTFLLLSLISGALELGCVLFGIVNKLTIYEIVGLGLAYQIGNLVPNPIVLNRNTILFVSLISVICFGTLSIHGSLYYVTFIGFMSISATLQYLRSIQKSSIPTGIKRIFRIIGFFLASIINVYWVLCCSIVLLILVFQMGNIVQKKYQFDFKFIDFIMVVHQLHYFSYVYFILYVLGELLHNTIMICTYFAIGWMTYTSISYLLVRRHYFKYFIIGHISLSVILLLMGYMIHDKFLVIILWVLTGFGGGTVFCIEKIYVSLSENKKDFTFSENIGHVIGVLIGLAVYTLFHNVNAVLFSSGIIAFMAVISMVVYVKYINHRRYDGK